MLPYNGGERFEWQHSYARIYPQKGKYRPDGVLMSFEHYNVEVRDRVKCISAMEGLYVKIFMSFMITCFGIPYL